EPTSGPFSEGNMGWQRNYVTLATGEQIRYTLFKRADSGVYYVRFKGNSGGRTKESTGEAKKANATEAAHRIILEHYGQTRVTSERVTWQVAKDKLTAAMRIDGKRPKTIKGYLETLNKLILLCPRTQGPGDVSKEMAAMFKAEYASGTFTRKRKLRE